MLAASNVDGTYVSGQGIYGHWWGHFLILDEGEDMVTWEGDYDSQIDKDWNQVITTTLHGRGDFAGLTVDLVLTTTEEAFPQFTARGVIVEEK